MYIGDNQRVGAHINEKQTIRGGQTGDQTGDEISVKQYWNGGWEYIIRYTANQVTTSPSKPFVSVSASDSAHPVTVSYNACENTTHYDIRFYDTNDNLVWAIGQCEDGANFGNLTAYTQTSYSHTFDAGSYYVTVAAVNNDSAKWNFSDAVSFTVAEMPKYPDKPVLSVSAGTSCICRFIRAICTDFEIHFHGVKSHL
jgi:hypothetical protein